MQLKRFFLVSLAILGTCLSQVALAQEVIVNDADYPVIRGKAPENRFTRTKGVAAAPFPFFEDFSTGELDTLKWDAHPELDSRVPTIGRSRALNPPTKGVLTFDGATYDRRKYDNLLATNYQDVLVSQTIDLSGFNVSDELYFTFFYQAGGYNDPPESFDSLVLSFDTTGNGDYQTVWQETGTGVAETRFNLVHFPLLEVPFFHPNFRFKFESYGSQNGELDVWHLDYIYFAANRNPDDTLFLDVSPVDIQGSPLGNYTAVPQHFYQTGGFSNNFDVLVGKPSGNAQTADLALLINDPVGGNNLTGSVSQNLTSAPVTAYINQDIPATAFSDQAVNWNNYGTFRVTVQSQSAGDARPENDTMAVEYRLDTILSYDDGQPDGGYGLTFARSFCQEYRIPERDTISAVWIAFPPTLNYNFVTSQSICMDGATFKLTLWDTLAPDSFTVQQGSGMIIDYGATEGYFQRFTFINPQVVDTVFWLGIRQNDNRPLGVGYDRQARAAQIYVEDQNAQFSPSSLSGGLMIRPEFANFTGPVGRGERADVVPVKVTLYPQPFRSGVLKVAMEGRGMGSGEWRVVDMQGRTVASGRVPAGQPNWEVNGLEALPAGMYLFDLQGKSVEGKTIVHRERLVVGA